LIDDTVKDILFALNDNKNKVYYTDKIYKINILDIFNLLKNSNLYKKHKFTISDNINNYEKIEETPLNNLDNLLNADLKYFLDLANIKI